MRRMKEKEKKQKDVNKKEGGEQRGGEREREKEVNLLFLMSSV